MKRTIEYIRNTLISYYSHQEIESFISMIFSHIYNYSKNDLILKSKEKLPELEYLRIAAIVDRLKVHEPLQYILGSTEFYGLHFFVSPDVLIPRPETEELVHLILKNHSNKAIKVLDVGTGSGCIPISLKMNRPMFDVYSCDISENALMLAGKNAQNNETDINLFQFDILSEQSFPYADFNLIVSNPPYVTEKEKEVMHPNVLEYEPQVALFVSDDDPLLFYRSIIMRAEEILSDDGEIYFEINEAYGKRVVHLLEISGFRAQLIKDINGKDRIVVGSRK